MTWRWDSAFPLARVRSRWSRLLSTTQLQPVHDLTVADVHTYFVVAANAPILVHNCQRAGLDFTDAERQLVYDANLAKNGGILKCEYCGQEVVRRPSVKGVAGQANDAQIDHRDPKALGGHGGAHNGEVTCRRCNRDKGAKTLEAWDDELREFLED
ncbi:HNH endonuclease [Actinosynnema sp. CA-248983]